MSFRVPVGEGALAVVVGAGVAGLLAARVLRKRGFHVKVIDRSSGLPSFDAVSGVDLPLDSRLHLITARAYRTLVRYFPSLDRDLQACDACVIDWCNDVRCVTEWGVAPRFRSSIMSRGCSRSLLERCLLNGFQGDCGIEFQFDSSVVDLLVDNSNRLGGLGIRTANGEYALLSPKVVVIATGGDRGQLKSLGLEPRSRTIPKRMGNVSFVSRIYRRPDSLDWKVLCHLSRPKSKSPLGMVVPIEHGGSIVSFCLAGHNLEAVDEHEFCGIAKRLGDKELCSFIERAVPESSICMVHGPICRRSTFDDFGAIPEGVVVVGDAACVVNPLSAKGLACAAIAAEELDAYLVNGRDSRMWPKKRVHVQRRLDAALKNPWRLSVFESHWALGSNVGQVCAIESLSNYLLKKGLLALVRSPFLFKRYMETYHLLRHPAIWLSPASIANVIWNQRASRGPLRHDCLSPS